MSEESVLRAEVDVLREALKELITWFPSAGTYRRLGFDPEAPMRAYEKARAALGHGVATSTTASRAPTTKATHARLSPSD